MPLAHSAAGIAVYIAFNPGPLIPKRVLELIIPMACVALAMMPDLDFLPGLLIGQPNLYHQGPTHSLFFMLVTSFLLFLVLNPRRDYPAPRFSSGRLLLCLLAAGLSHPILDFFSLDMSKPMGIPLFWPLTAEHFTSPWPLFLNVERDNLPGTAFFWSLFSLHNLRALIREAIFGAATICLAAGIRWGRVTR